MNAALQPANEHVERILNAAVAEGTLDLPPPPQIAAEVMRLTRGDAVAGEARVKIG